MPPLQRRASFNRKDVAKAFFDLEISDSEPPTTRKIPKPRNSQVASKPPLDAAKRNNTVGFLDLPTPYFQLTLERKLTTRQEALKNWHNRALIDLKYAV